MRYSAPEKLEIIKIVEQSHLPVRRMLAQLGIPWATFDRRCDIYQTGGPDALEGRSPRPGRVQGQDHGDEPALADRLYLSQGHRLGLVLSVDDPGRLLLAHIIAWKLCTAMKASEVSDTLEMALEVSGAPYHPQTQIERWHQTLKNRILLEKERPGRSQHRRVAGGHR